MSLFDFKLPHEEKRKFRIDNGLLRWVVARNDKYRYDPDAYILTLAFRSYFIFAVICSLVALSFIYIFPNYSEENLLNYTVFIVDTISPLSLFITGYFFVWFQKNVDTDKYTLLKNRATGVQVPATLGVIIGFPILTFFRFSPMHSIFVYHSHEHFRFLLKYHDELWFVAVCLSVHVLAYSVLCLAHQAIIQMAVQVYADYQKRKGGVDNE